MVEFRAEEVEFKVPIKAPNLSAISGAQEMLRSTTGRFMLALQNDGNLVLYDMQTAKPLWASGTVVV